METSERPLPVAARNTHATDMGGPGVHLALRPASEAEPVVAV